MIDYTVFKGTEAAVEIDTANVAVRPAQTDGVYRVEVNAEGETQVIVRKGSAEISTPQGSTQVEKGQMVDGARHWRRHAVQGGGSAVER